MKEHHMAPLCSWFLHEIILDVSDPQEMARIQRYLEQDLRCLVKVLDSHRYHVLFPAGTAEEIPAGQSTVWTYRTIIRFANGTRLPKEVREPLQAPQQRQTLIVFPESVLKGPDRRKQTTRTVMRHRGRTGQKVPKQVS